MHLELRRPVGSFFCYSPRMPQCSICSRPGAAAIVNELFEKKTTLAQIATQTGFHPSSVYRHNRNCFPKWKALKLKSSKVDPVNCRFVVSWSDPRDESAPRTFSTVTANEHGVCRNVSLTAADLKPNDLILEIQWVKHRAAPKIAAEVTAVAKDADTL
jgi:hypothetical protein